MKVRAVTLTSSDVPSRATCVLSHEIGQFAVNTLPDAEVRSSLHQMLMHSSFVACRVVSARHRGAAM